MKSISHRNTWLAAGILAAVMMVIGGISWACTYNPRIDMDPSFGAAGDEVAARGSGFRAGTLVEIRWNSANGPVLAQTVVNQSNQFSVAAVIPRTQAEASSSGGAAPQGSTGIGLGGNSPQGPDGGPGEGRGGPPAGGGEVLADGVYYVVAVIGGNVQATTSFEVRTPASRGTVAGGQGGSLSGSTSVEGFDSQLTGGSPAVSGGSVEAQQGAPVAPREGRGSPQEQTIVRTIPGASTPASARPPAMVLPDGRTVFGGSVPAQGTGGGINGDLWSGFKSKSRTSLVPGFEEGPLGSPGGGNSAALGLAVVALAGLATVGGFLTSEKGRRRRNAVQSEPS